MSEKERERQKKIMINGYSMQISLLNNLFCNRRELKAKNE